VPEQPPAILREPELRALLHVVDTDRTFGGRRAGLGDGVHPHLLRHTYAHMALSSGMQETDLVRVAGVVGKLPVEAAAFARAMSHTVVFNVQIPGYGECWCVPPPEGQVVSAWWGQHGALWLEVDGVDEGHTKDNQPLRGWGC
jgi:hypothetical protein